MDDEPRVAMMTTHELEELSRARRAGVVEPMMMPRWSTSFKETKATHVSGTGSGSYPFYIMNAHHVLFLLGIIIISLLLMVRTAGSYAFYIHVIFLRVLFLVPIRITHIFVFVRGVHIVIIDAHAALGRSDAAFRGAVVIMGPTIVVVVVGMVGSRQSHVGPLLCPHYELPHPLIGHL